MTDRINNHAELARDKLIGQYKQAENLIAILDGFSSEIQELEDAIYDLLESRMIQNAVGVTLDNWGALVGQPRLGFNDELYRILIYTKIGENVSQGETERVRSVYRLITQATRVQLQEHYPAGMVLMSNGTINPISARFIWERMQSVVGAGIRVDQIGDFSESNPFGFLGAPDAQGLSDINQIDGGVMGCLYDISLPFGLSEQTQTDTGQFAGMGTLQDHIVGGRLISVTDL